MAARDRREGRGMFEGAVAASPLLRLLPGLKAIPKREGRERLQRGEARVLGSVNLDANLLSAQPKANRWDFIVGVGRAAEEVAYFVEVHPAQTHEVDVVAKKLDWLLDFLNEETQVQLKRLPKEIHWIASGRMDIPKNTPQFKRIQKSLRARGLRGPVTSLTLD